MKNKLLFGIIFVLCLSFTVFGQNQQIASVVHTQIKINSQILGEERTVLVRVPANYAGRDEKYPVVYMLDAHAPQNGYCPACRL